LLTAKLLDITGQKLLGAEGTVRVLGPQTKTIIGRLFEGLVAQSLKVYADANGVGVRHLRTVRGDHEIDFIIEQGETLLAIEAKFFTHISSNDVKQLNWLEKALPEMNVVKAVVYAGAHLVQRESDDILLIPAACLGA